jgi:hypothetical protein
LARLSEALSTERLTCHGAVCGGRRASRQADPSRACEERVSGRG